MIVEALPARTCDSAADAGALLSAAGAAATRAKRSAAQSGPRILGRCRRFFIVGAVKMRPVGDLDSGKFSIGDLIHGIQQLEIAKGVLQ